MFRAIATRNIATLEELALKFHSENVVITTVLALDYIFSTSHKFKIASAAEISSRLSLFHTYIQLLQELRLKDDPCHDSDVRKLCALEATTEDWFLVPKNTRLYRFCNDRLSPTRREVERGYLVGSWELKEVFKSALEDRLSHRISEVHEACHDARAFRPCLPFIALGHCSWEGRCLREHIRDGQIDEDAYNLRVRIHVQHIVIYNATRKLRDTQDPIKQQLYVL